MIRVRIRSALESTGFFPLPVVNLVLVFALVGLVLPLYWRSPIVAIAFGVVFFVGPSIGMGAAWWAHVLKNRVYGQVKSSSTAEKESALVSSNPEASSVVGESESPPLGKKEAWRKLQEMLDNPPKKPLLRDFLEFDQEYRLTAVVMADADDADLDATIKSLLEQSSPNWEVVILGVPPATPDGQSSPPHADSLGSRLIAQIGTTEGLASACEEALASVRTQYVTFVQAGERLLPHFVAEALMRFKITGAEAGAFGYLTQHDEGRRYEEATNAVGLGKRDFEAVRDAQSDGAGLLASVDSLLTGKVFKSETIRKSHVFFPEGERHSIELLTSLPWLMSAKRVWLSTKAMSIRPAEMAPGGLGDQLAVFSNLQELSTRLRKTRLPHFHHDTLSAVVERWVKGTVDSGEGLPYDLTESLQAWSAALVWDAENFAGETDGKQSSGTVSGPVSTTPLVTIVVPVRDRLELLDALLGSIKGQYVGGLEIIMVVDPGQEADFADVQDRIPDGLPVMLLPGISNGAGPGRNLGAQHASGRYLWFVDSDDLLPHGAIARVFNRLAHIESDVALFNAEHFVHPDEAPKPASWFLRTSGIEQGRDYSPFELSDRLFQLTSPSPWNLLFRREFFQNEGVQFSALPSSNDVSCVMTALASARTIRIHDEVIYVYRRGAPRSLQSRTENLALPRAFRELREQLKVRQLHSHFAGTLSELTFRTLVVWWVPQRPFRLVTLLLLFPELLAIAKGRKALTQKPVKAVPLA